MSSVHSGGMSVVVVEGERTTLLKEMVVESFESDLFVKLLKFFRSIPTI